MKMSPSASSSPNFPISAAISPVIEAMWIGSEASAWTTRRPLRSMIAVEWSRRSLMLVENALFISAMYVSSATERSPL